MGFWFLCYFDVRMCCVCVRLYRIEWAVVVNIYMNQRLVGIRDCMIIFFRKRTITAHKWFARVLRFHDGDGEFGFERVRRRR